MSETVRVRIAVAINSDGQYEAAGADGQDDGEREDYAQEWLLDRSGENSAVHFVEADVPIPVKPEPQTIEGVVESEPEGGR